jgi:hypothetical protein
VVVPFEPVVVPPVVELREPVVPVVAVPVVAVPVVVVPLVALPVVALPVVEACEPVVPVVTPLVPDPVPLEPVVMPLEPLALPTEPVELPVTCASLAVAAPPLEPLDVTEEVVSFEPLDPVEFDTPRVLASVSPFELEAPPVVSEPESAPVVRAPPSSSSAPARLRRGSRHWLNVNRQANETKRRRNISRYE